MRNTEYDKARAFRMDCDEGLSAILAAMDTSGRYDTYKAIWWDTDAVVPAIRRSAKDRTFRLAVPIVWQSAPKEIIEEMFRILTDPTVYYATLRGKTLKNYLTSKEFIKNLRQIIPDHEEAKDPRIFAAVQRAKDLLYDRPSKVSNILICWRTEPADLFYSPIASVHPYARIIWLDPAMREAPKDLFDWIIFHAMCHIATFRTPSGRPHKKRMMRLLDRWEDHAEQEDMMDVIGWWVEYDLRYLQSENGEDGEAEEDER